MKAEAIKEAAALTQEAVDLYFKGYYDEARSLLTRSIALAPRVSRPHAAMALCLAQLGNARDGLDYAEKAVNLDAASAVALTTRAFCLHRLGEDDRAVMDFERAAEIDPGDFRVWYNFACHWAERGEEEKCREILITAVDLAPGHFAAVLAADPDLGRYSQTPWFKDILARLKVRMK